MCNLNDLRERLQKKFFTLYDILYSGFALIVLYWMTTTIDGVKFLVALSKAIAFVSLVYFIYVCFRFFMRKDVQKKTINGIFAFRKIVVDFFERFFGDFED